MGLGNDTFEFFVKILCKNAKVERTRNTAFH